MSLEIVFGVCDNEPNECRESSQIGKHGFGLLHNLNWCRFTNEVVLTSLNSLLRFTKKLCRFLWSFIPNVLCLWNPLEDDGYTQTQSNLIRKLFILRDKSSFLISFVISRWLWSWLVNCIVFLNCYVKPLTWISSSYCLNPWLSASIGTEHGRVT